MPGARQDEGRKIIMKRLVRGEKGYVLIAALLVLVVLGLISGPLLSYMVSGLKAGHVFETGADELYAADAGAQDAMWRIQEDMTPLCTANPGPWCYDIPDVNGRSVHVCIQYDVNGGIWNITSTAITDTGGGVAALPSSTSVAAYLDVQFMDFSALLDNAIVSDNSITIKNGVNVTGNITSGGTVDNKGTVDGTITKNAELDWPAADDLSAYYLNQVEDGVHYDGNTLLNLEDNSCPPGPIYKTIDRIREAVSWPDGLGPLKVNGTLDITSLNNREMLTLKLNDTLYITGDTVIGQTGQDFILDLNGQTIFVKSSSADALTIGGKCSILGPGCIIAVGDVYFAPKGDVGSEDGFVLVMSIEGTTTLQPSGTFYGCIAGDLAVDVESGNNAIIVNTGLAEGQDLNFPSGIGDDPNELPPVTDMRIESWEVSRQ
jgi:hypothetical protein